MLKEKEFELYERWRTERNYEYFISDGIFDEAEWHKQDIKILFVLKEANWENGNVDLCKYLLSECSPTYWKTWNNITRWIQAILVSGEYPRNVSKSDKSFWLRKVAAMNLKKVGGDAIAENKTIYNYAVSDKRYLKEQICLYSPDIIICCGRGEGKNADIIHDVVFENNEVSEWQRPLTDTKYNYFFLSIGNKSIPVVSFYHPQMRGGHELFKKRYDEMVQIGEYFKNTIWRKGK